MILPDFYLSSRANCAPSIECGMDALLYTDKNYGYTDKKDYFLNYPYPVEYRFNNRGFRDADWPTDTNELQNAIWCFGDSFTVGLGSSYNHIWSQVLQTRSQRRTINVSMDGASNQWIARKVDKLCHEIAPKTIVILWSYLHRREQPDQSKSDEDRRDYGGRSSDEEDYNNFIQCVELVNKHKYQTQIIHLTIPDAQSCYDIQLSWDNFKGPDWPTISPRSISEFNLMPDFVKNEIVSFLDKNKKFQALLERNDMFDKYKETENILEVPRLDLARDSHHFDIKTSKWISAQILTNLSKVKC